MPTATADTTSVSATDVVAGAAAPGTGSHETATAAWRAALGARMRAGSTVAFRVAFGLLVAYSSLRFLARGWVEEFYLSPENHLSFARFDWVRPWPTPLMYGHVAAIAVLGIAIAVGYRTRLAATLFTVGFTYLELIDASLYLNHYWYMTLAGVVLAVAPGPRADGTVPALTVWALRLQLAMVYVFAGIAKINSDWLFRGEPLHTWLSVRTDRPLIGPLLDEPGVALAFSWAGMLFDLTIVGWLLWRRSRAIAYVVLVGFHVTTAILFQIGVFPWVMIALTPIFFAPDWPSRLFRSAHRSAYRSGATSAPKSFRPTNENSVSTPVLLALAALVALNIALPMRHWLSDGGVRWNDDGYYLSWRVMLTDRVGYLEFDVVDPTTGDRWRVVPESVLTEWQAAEAETRPDLALATAHLIAEDFANRGYGEVDVRADSWVAFNGRLRQRYIDPSVDLSDVSRTASAAAYVLPLDPPTLD